MKVSAVCTITKSLPIKFFTIVSYSLLANFGYINLFYKKNMIDNLKSHIEQFFTFCDTDWNDISSYFNLHQVKKNHVLVKEGLYVGEKYFIVSGIVKAYEINEEGKEFIIQFGKENIWITDFKAFFNNTYAKLNVDCVTDCLLISVSRKNKEILCTKYHQMANYFRLMAEDSFVFAQLRLLSQMRETAEERYNALLQRSPDLVQRVPKKLLASYLGVSKETLSRL